MIRAILVLVSLVGFAVAGIAQAQTSVSGSGTGIVTGGSISFDDLQHGGSVGADLTGHAMSVNFSFNFIDDMLFSGQFMLSVEDVPVVGTYSISGYVDPFSEFSSLAFSGGPTGGSAEINYNAFFADSFFGWSSMFSRLGNGHYTLTGGATSYENQNSPLGGDIFFGIGYAVGDAQIVFLGVPEAGSWTMLILGFGAVGWAARRRGAPRRRAARA